MTGMTIAIALIGVILICAVLIQNPKGGGIDSTFGSGANQMFGASGSANIIEKATSTKNLGKISYFKFFKKQNNKC